LALVGGSIMERQVSGPVGQSPAGRTVADVMRPAATTVETDGHLASAAYLMQHANQSALVVIDAAGRPAAIITESDLLRAVARGADTEHSRIGDWMNRNPQTVRPDTVVTEAAQIMFDSAERHLPVVADGRVVGIVAISEIFDALVGSVRLASVVVFVPCHPWVERPPAFSDMFGVLSRTRRAAGGHTRSGRSVHFSCVVDHQLYGHSGRATPGRRADASTARSVWRLL
jgi:CBS domain-containing protein